MDEQNNEQNNKKNLTALFMAWGNFTVIPCPYKHWDSRLNHRMLMFLPVIGAVIGVVWIVCLTLLRWIGLPYLLLAASAEFLIFRLCGYMHLDGFMDVSDAVMSRRSLEERQRILKDSRVGAFAVICLLSLLLVWFAASVSLFSALGRATTDSLDIQNAAALLPYFLILIPVFSRACAGRMVLTYDPIRSSQYVQGNSDPGKKKYRIGIYILVLVLEVVFCILLCALAVRKQALFGAYKYLRALQIRRGVRPSYAGYAAMHISASSAALLHGFGKIWAGTKLLIPHSASVVISAGGMNMADKFLYQGIAESFGSLSIKIGLVPCGLIFAAVMLAVMWTAGWLACRHARRQLGGMNGDIAGYTICISELAGIILLAFFYM
ncbi:MAG: adenosylcobinamide-GDP ribazoletransferase [Eubacterium sp.]